LEKEIEKKKRIVTFITIIKYVLHTLNKTRLCFCHCIH